MKSFHSSDVVVIGGGASGCATAYYLSKKGASVTIVEREGIATQASGYSAGMLNPLTGIGIPGGLQNLAKMSFRLHQELWNSLIDETGFNFHPEKVSTIDLLFEESEIPSLENIRKTYETEDGFESYWLEKSELDAIKPSLSPEVKKGLYTWGNCSLDSMILTKAFANSAMNLLGFLITGNVTGIESQGGRVTAVITRDGKIDCGAVVFASGPWSAEGEEWLNICIPVTPLKGQIIRTKLQSVETQPSHDFNGSGISLYRKRDGLIWVGATEENVGFDQSQTAEAKRHLLTNAIRIMPEIKNSEVVMHTVCLRPITPDWLPIIGKAPGWENVWLNTGAGKKGILLCPAMGKATADLIVSDNTDVPIQGFDPSRFQ